jgi:hypothetical protein
MTLPKAFASNTSFVHQLAKLECRIHRPCTIPCVQVFAIPLPHKTSTATKEGMPITGRAIAMHSTAHDLAISSDNSCKRGLGEALVSPWPLFVAAPFA